MAEITVELVFGWMPFDNVVQALKMTPAIEGKTSATTTYHQAYIRKSVQLKKNRGGVKYIQKFCPQKVKFEDNPVKTGLK